MYRRLGLLLILAALARPLLASSSCSAYPAGTWKRDKASVLQFEHTWLQMLTDKNMAALDCMLAGNFKDTSMKGMVRPKSQVLREVPLRSNQYQQNLTDLEAELFDDTAVVRGLDVVTDQPGHEIMRVRFTDVLRFADGRWYAVASQETAEPQAH